MQPSVFKGNLIDIWNRKIFPAKITVANNIIQKIEEVTEPFTHYILPGFVDAHIHIESSMLTPYEFARVALTHGTAATVSDPHEIANVCGLDGVMYMLENAKHAKLKFNFGAPSCVPATSFETAGATLNAEDVEQLLKRDDIKYLSEMMNYPGVLFGDEQAHEKIKTAHSLNKPVDGHAPGLRGPDAKKYIDAGISTDHECFTLEEALDKIEHGMKIIIREGSAAKNFEALHSLISSHPNMVMLCSDDKHPDDLLEGHINLLVKRALQKGHNLFDVLQCACVNPVLHYKLDVGLLKEKQAADFIVVDSIEKFNVLQTLIDGEVVAEKGKSVLVDKVHSVINNFSCKEIKEEDIKLSASAPLQIKIIEALDGQLITNCITDTFAPVNGFLESNTDKDYLKILVVNRYQNQKPVVGFIKNMGLKTGAIAGTVAHDSHNIIATGVDDDSIVRAINLLIKNKGGLSAVNSSTEKVIALPIAGLMSDKSCIEIGTAYKEIDMLVKEMGSKLRSPFMTLSFMALLVIPNFKIGDKGLFDVKSFGFTSLKA
ncbi:MAG TPA: adenine deaminase [Bacteroidia bacterium]|nr:adenine deaminase [Bacteroidia bacterium]HNU33674.1 adenine deaminase [Bacteroidia bacterium]